MMEHTQSSPANTDPMIGEVIAGRYRIESLIGKGGMGRIYKARQDVLNRDVAIKFLIPAGGASDDAAAMERLRKRFDREARMISRIQHPNAVTLHDYGTTDHGEPYLIMELLRGEDLEQVFKRETGGMAPELVAYISCQALMALAESHRQGIIHRDIKPSNIFLEDRGGPVPWVKVLDFGAGKFSGSVAGNTGVTQAGELIGTWHYMAPEQAMGEAVDTRMDIYAMGSLMYEMLTGELPFDDSNMQSFLMDKMMNPPRPIPPELGVPEGLRAILFKALEKNPDDRYQTADAMVEALLPFAPDMVGTGAHRMVDSSSSGVHAPGAVSSSVTPAPEPPAPAPTPQPSQTSASAGPFGLPRPLVLMLGLLVLIILIALGGALVLLTGS
ncbi:MAG: hypothetical protein CMH57_06260 [Myxococcales bacterium]|nr:hypothetical protein [Myxococcales bacterium]